MNISAKPLKLVYTFVLLLGMILILNACVVVRSGPAYTSRPVAPPSPAYYDWYYYPTAGVYYNVTEHYYYYPSQGRWYRATQLPQGWVIYSQDRVRMRISGLPYREHAKHRLHYPPKRNVRHDHDRYRNERHEQRERHEDYRDRDAPRYSEHQRTEERRYDSGRYEEHRESGATFKSPFIPPKGQARTPETIRDRGENGRASPRSDDSTASRHHEQHNNNNRTENREANPVRGTHGRATQGNKSPSVNDRNGKGHNKSDSRKKHSKKGKQKKKSHKKDKGKSDTTESQSSEEGKDSNNTESGGNTFRGRFQAR